MVHKHSVYIHKQHFGLFLEEFADNKLIVDKMYISLLDRIKSIVGKCWSPAFSPFSTMVSNVFFFRFIENRSVW